VADEAHKAIIARFFEQAVNQRNYPVIDELVAPSFVLHSALLGDVHGGDAYKQSVLGLMDTCQDLHATVQDLIAAEDDSVVARLTYRGTDTGGFVRGYAATGKPFEFGAIYIWRLANSKIVELWQESDRLRLMQQLGIVNL